MEIPRFIDGTPPPETRARWPAMSDARAVFHAARRSVATACSSVFSAAFRSPRRPGSAASSRSGTSSGMRSWPRVQLLTVDLWRPSHADAGARYPGPQISTSSARSVSGCIGCRPGGEKHGAAAFPSPHEHGTSVRAFADVASALPLLRVLRQQFAARAGHSIFHRLGGGAPQDRGGLPDFRFDFDRLLISVSPFPGPIAG